MLFYACIKCTDSRSTLLYKFLPPKQLALHYLLLTVYYLDCLTYEAYDKETIMYILIRVTWIFFVCGGSLRRSSWRVSH